MKLRVSSAVALVGLASLLSPTLAIRPRGVRAELATFYNPASDFACLDGSGSVPFIQVNDDYCDCDDGSDEPGTAACPEGKFYCENKGHKSLIIPSSRVNDGVCADECMELGREAREAAIAAAKVAAQGYNIKQGMIEEAKRLQQERGEEVVAKEREKSELEANKEQLRAAKEAAEAPEKEALDFYRQLEEEEQRKKTELEQLARDVEAEELFAALDANVDGVVVVQELQVRLGLDTDKDGVVSVEEAQFFMSGHEEFDIESFKQVAFPLMKPYLDLEATSTPDPSSSDDLEGDDDGETPDLVQDPSGAGTPGQPEVYDPWRQNQQVDTDADTDNLDSEDQDDDEALDEEDEDDYDIENLPSHEYQPPAEPVIQPSDRYDDKTRNLIAEADKARKEFEDAERRLRDLDRELNKLKEGMDKDYGLDGEFMVLAGQCFEYTENQYTYKMCPFDHASQREKHGGGDTRLGSWGSWEGPAGARYTKMKFSNGQGCWNGPSRSALVHIHCGTDNELSHVTEPNRCEYEMHFKTPAACQKPAPGGPHDEL